MLPLRWEDKGEISVMQEGIDSPPFEQALGKYLASCVIETTASLLRHFDLPAKDNAETIGVPLVRELFTLYGHVTAFKVAGSLGSQKSHAFTNKVLNSSKLELEHIFGEEINRPGLVSFYAQRRNEYAKCRLVAAEAGTKLEESIIGQGALRAAAVIGLPRDPRIFEVLTIISSDIIDYFEKAQLDQTLQNIANSQLAPGRPTTHRDDNGKLAFSHAHLISEEANYEIVSNNMRDVFEIMKPAKTTTMKDLEPYIFVGYCLMCMGYMHGKLRSEPDFQNTLAQILESIDTDIDTSNMDLSSVEANNYLSHCLSWGYEYAGHNS